MKWITRERPKIDRIACPWLIQNFVDKEAEFIFVPKDQVFQKAKELDAIPYDLPGAEYTHEAGNCTFDYIVKKHAIEDPAIHQIAVIVRGADTDRFDLAPQAAGLWAISAGLSHLYHDDHEQLAIGLKLYDALYAWAKFAQQEKTHVESNMMNEGEPTHLYQTPIQIFIRFLRFGFLAFGGPVAQIGMLKQELVEEEKWVSREEFNRALAVYQVLPGPEAHEMCVWFGMIAGGRLGGFLAGLGFMLPGFVLMLGLTWIYFTFGIENPIAQSLFIGFSVAVIALIFNAVKRIGQHSITNKELLVIALFSAVVTYLG